MLPPPTLTFTIPSIHDGAILECRIYHPSCLAPKTHSQITAWERKKVAIVAHPYAPLGGSYDDAVVDLTAGTVLKEGWIVGTFNFRGAGASKGHTSWSSIPEQKDYMSFVGFMVHYMHYLTFPVIPPCSSSADQSFHTPNSNLESRNGLTPVPSHTLPPPHTYTHRGIPASDRPLLLLAGYSYGSLIATSLPPGLMTILSPFQNPASGTPYADIKSRARFLAQQQNEIMENTIAVLNATEDRRIRLQLESKAALEELANQSRPSSRGVRMGGDEDIRRASRDWNRKGSRKRRSYSVDASGTAARAEEKVRRSVERVKSMVVGGGNGNGNGTLPRRGQSLNSGVSGSKSDTNGATEIMDTGVRGGEGNEGTKSLRKDIEGESLDTDAVTVEVVGDGIQLAYLLVSPLPPGGVINSLATLGNLKAGFGFLGGKQKFGHVHGNGGGNENENDRKFTVDPTLVVHGLGDPFVTAKTFRRWVERLNALDGGVVGGNGDEDEEGARKKKFQYSEIENGEHFWRNAEAARSLKGMVRGFVGELSG